MRAPVAALAVAISALAAPSVHAQDQAGCQQRASLQQEDPNASLAVGDSVMLAAADELAAYGFSVDAQACRRMDQGLALMRERRLPSLVVVALGSNGAVSAGQLRGVLELMGPFGRIVFVLPRALGGRPDPDGRVFQAAAQAYPDQVSVLDWPAYSSGRDGWFEADGLHLSATGATQFARFVAEAPELGPAPEEIEPPPVPEPEPRREPRRRAPASDPLLAAMWRTLGHVFAVIIDPAARLLGQLVHGGRPLRREL